MLFLIVFLLGDRYLQETENDEERGYTIALIITCSVSGMVIICLMVNAVKDACFVEQLEEWRIYS